MPYTNEQLEKMLSTVRTVEKRIIRVRDVQTALGLSSESQAHAIMLDMLKAGLIGWRKTGNKRGEWFLV